MANYHLSKKGEDFIDGHYREFQGSGGVSVDRVIQWLWWLRESGDFKANNLKLIEDVGNERAGNVLNWAVHKGYLEEDHEGPEEEPWNVRLLREREERQQQDAHPSGYSFISGSLGLDAMTERVKRRMEAEKSPEERQAAGDEWYKERAAAIAAMRERMRLQRGE